MDNMNKQRLEIIGAIVVIVGVILLLFLLLRKGPDATEPSGETPAPVQEVNEAAFPRTITNAEPLYLPDPIARSFVERFGSFSTESDFKNLVDVQVFATDSLKTELERVLADAKSRVSGYYGVSTRVINIEKLEETESTATILVKTQRVETIDDPQNTAVRYQDIELEMVREGDTWLVATYAWR